MKDMKYKKLLSGNGGAPCLLCDSQIDDWVNTEKVIEGFPISRSAEETEVRYNALVNSEGQITRKPRDFDVRKGLTNKPYTTSDQRSITITHQYINVTSWFIKLLSRVHIDYLRWEEKKTCLGDPIRRSTERVLDRIEEVTGLRLEQVQSSGHGGTSTDGNSGRRFFSEELVEVINQLAPDKHWSHIVLLHQQISAILRVISSSDNIRTESLQELCINTSMNIATNFKWVPINFTLHSSLHHSAELISLNGDRGLGELSEEALEANNKDIRLYMNTHSRKSDPILQLTDVMNRTLERSHPCVRYAIEQFRPKKQCTKCGSTSHTIRSHHTVVGGGARRHFDQLVADILD